MRIKAWEGPEDPQMKLQPNSNEGILQYHKQLNMIVKGLKMTNEKQKH